MIKIVELINLFGMLSLLAVGGGTAVLPQMKYDAVYVYHFVSPGQFTEIYSLGQLAPGPNMMSVILIGYEVSGWLGAVAVLFAFFVPSTMLCYFVSEIWDAAAGSPWRDAVQRGMAPIVIGLMLAGCYALGKTASFDPSRDWELNALTLAIGGVVVAVLSLTRINPALTILGGGVAGYLLLR
ncbi:MAG: chromate transporter [Candidatus Promineifilaceae bacterium]